MKITLIVLLIARVFTEGYNCPYPDLGYDGSNSLLYDYYDSHDGGNSWVRLGQTGWTSTYQYCADKANIGLHFDAGEAKCSDSQGTCYWDGSTCVINTGRVPDCYALCQAVVNGQGLSCMGNCPEGNVSRDTFYAICDNSESPAQPSQGPPQEPQPEPSEEPTQEPAPTQVPTEVPRAKPGKCKKL